MWLIQTKWTKIREMLTIIIELSLGDTKFNENKSKYFYSLP